MCSKGKGAGLLTLLGVLSSFTFFCVIFAAFNEPKPSIERLRKAYSGLGYNEE
ncbi:MAG: hypothetical protein ABH857_02325 [Elusimicrobiota bacterium]